MPKIYDENGVLLMEFKRFWVIMAIAVLQSLLVARAAESPAPPAGAQPVQIFPILEYRVEGNTVLPAIEIERAVTSYLGEGKTIKDVEAARASLEKAYHDRGYQTVLVNIPQQEVVDGIVRLAVLESPIGKAQIKGSRYHSLEVISATVPQLEGGVVPNFNEVQKEMAQVNRSPDLRVTPVLKASATPGQVDVDLDVQEQLPLHATLEANNRYSANTDHLRLIGSVDYDNLFQRNQSISIQYQVAPENSSQAEIWSASYVIPMQNGLVWALYGVHSNSNVAAVGSTDVIGKGDVYGLRLIDPLPWPGSSFYHSFTAGMDYKDWKQNVAVQGAGEIPSPASYILYSLQYSATWLGPVKGDRHATAATNGARSNTTFELGSNFTVRGFSATDEQQFADKRAGASPSFLVFHASLQRQQILPRNFSMVLDLNGQLASGPLITNEQYAAGGVDSVRGYTEAERLGDTGARASLELRSPQLLAGHERFTNSYVYLFGDVAQVSLLDPLPGEHTNYHLESEGLGFRFKYGGVLADVDGARVDTPGYVTRGGSYSVQFRVNYTW